MTTTKCDKLIQDIEKFADEKWRESKGLPPEKPIQSIVTNDDLQKMIAGYIAARKEEEEKKKRKSDGRGYDKYDY